MAYIREERRSFLTISQAEYDKQSDLAIQNQPIRKEVLLSDIEVMKDDIISYKGTAIRMTQKAFKDICKIVGLPVGFEKTFTKSFGEKARKSLLNRLKTATAVNSKANVTLIVNPETRSVVAVHKSRNTLISHSAFLDTTTSLVDRYGLEVNNFTRNDDGSLIINASSPKNHFGLKGLKDEEYFGGVTFENSISGGFSVSPYLHRLICSNGMIGSGFEETLKLAGLKPNMSEDFFVQLNQMAERSFRPMALQAKVEAAMATPASLAEMSSAYELLLANSGMDPRTLEEWIPYPSTVNAFIGAKIDPVLFNDEQRRRAKTGTSVWDVINGITHFATHDNGMTVSDNSRRKMQREAGDLLTKKVFDIQNTVPSPFG